MAVLLVCSNIQPASESCRGAGSHPTSSSDGIPCDGRRSIESARESSRATLADRLGSWHRSRSATTAPKPKKKNKLWTTSWRATPLATTLATSCATRTYVSVRAGSIREWPVSVLAKVSAHSAVSNTEQSGLAWALCCEKKQNACFNTIVNTQSLSLVLIAVLWEVAADFTAGALSGEDEQLQLDRRC